VTTKVDRLLTQDNIFKIPLSGLMIQVFHYTLPKYSSNGRKRARLVQSIDHSHSSECPMAPQTMAAMPTKPIKTVTMVKRNCLKEKAMFFSPYFL